SASSAHGQGRSLAGRLSCPPTCTRRRPTCRAASCCEGTRGDSSCRPQGTPSAWESRCSRVQTWVVPPSECLTGAREVSVDPRLQGGLHHAPANARQGKVPISQPVSRLSPLGPPLRLDGPLQSLLSAVRPNGSETTSEACP